MRHLLAALLLLAACAAEPDARPTTRATVGSAVLRVELATTAEQRSAGLRGREVPPGFGMAFPYEPAQRVHFTMSQVDRPLVAVFARAGRAVSVEHLLPCPGGVDECPLYGPAEPVDLVVEAAPESLPDVRPGDAVEVR